MYVWVTNIMCFFHINIHSNKQQELRRPKRGIVYIVIHIITLNEWAAHKKNSRKDMSYWSQLTYLSSDFKRLLCFFLVGAERKFHTCNKFMNIFWLRYPHHEGRHLWVKCIDLWARMLGFILFYRMSKFYRFKFLIEKHFKTYESCTVNEFLFGSIWGEKYDRSHDKRKCLSFPRKRG